MRVPIEWLHDYVRPDLSTAELGERLAMTGTEVERIERHGVPSAEHFVIGRVLSAEQHPNADRLRVCTVNLGEQYAPVQIVCGAPNVAAGQTVIVARPGATMPNGMVLKAAKLRGEESNGMICSEDELSIGQDHAGILVLDKGTPGQPAADLIPIGTDVLVLEITPNRPDCLSIYGVAREAHAATGAALQPEPWLADPGTEGTVAEASVTVECPELCPRFTARVFENVTIGPSPAWLKARLSAAGQRPISNVVDISNYVMLLTGQPIHTFDLDRVAGASLTVRKAKHNETVTTLDGKQRTLDDTMVVIDDAQGPTSIAAIMGGERSEINDGTTRVLLEAATWDGPNIHRTSKKLGLRSEASGRFEKQLQPEQAMHAQAIATRLMLELTGAGIRPGTIDIGGPGPAARTIRLRDKRVTSLLGAEIPRATSAAVLNKLDFATQDADDGLDVTVPPLRRKDVTREADVIEEVARLEALDDLPATLPSRHGASGRLTPRQILRRKAADALTAQGLHEIVGWSFTDPGQPQRLGQPERPLVTLKNPMSVEQSTLRGSLVGSLLDAVAYNHARGATRIALFESGAVYRVTGARLPSEPHHVAAMLAGPIRRPTWRDPQPPRADFYAAKGAMTALMSALGISAETEPHAWPHLHPGRSAAIRIGEQTVGWVGEIHPTVAARWELDGLQIACFGLDLNIVASLAPGTTLYAAISSFPEVREDLAIVVSDGVSAGAVVEKIRAAGAPLLTAAEVFDVYRDASRLGAGKVSLAVRLSFSAPDRTLTDDEVAATRAQILTALQQELQGQIRA
jgi:phenylalanyl-tRNA synthetase beta chain